MEKLAKMVKQDQLDHLDLQERGVFQACQVSLDLKDIVDFPDWMELKVQWEALEKRVNKEDLVKLDPLDLWGQQDQEEKEAEKVHQDHLD